MSKISIKDLEIALFSLKLSANFVLVELKEVSSLYLRAIFFKQIRIVEDTSVIVMQEASDALSKLQLLNGEKQYFMRKPS